MDRIILPFEIDVICKGYHDKAFPLGVIKANIPDFDKWLCNKLTNFVYRDDNGKFEIYDDDIWSVKEGLTSVFQMNLHPATGDWEVLNLLELNKRMLSLGYYVTGSYNEFYIPAKEPYQKYKLIHDYVIFGYDDIKKVFKSAGYVASQKYEYFEFGYDDYVESIRHIYDGEFWTEYHCINDSYRTEINVEGIILKIQTYLKSQVNCVSQNTKDVFGILACEKYGEYMRSREGDSIQLRYARAYMEHKAVMDIRLGILYRGKIIRNQEIVEAYHEKIYNKAKAAFILSMRYHLEQRTEIVKKIYQLVDIINLEEKIILEKVVTDLINIRQ